MEDQGYDFSENPNFKLIEKQPEGKEQQKKENRLVRIEQEIKSVLTQAMQPLYEFVNMVEASSGVKIWYHYVEDKKRESAKIPLVTGCETADEFRQKNWFLGTTLINMLLLSDDEPRPKKKQKTKKKKDDDSSIGSTYTFQRKLYRKHIDKNATRYEIENAPQFIWALLPDAVFQYLLEKHFGAIIMAADELQFPYKDLILSPFVRCKFAEYVSRKYVAPRQNGFASMAQGGGMTFRIASGAYTSKMSNIKVLLGTKEFFKNVHYVQEKDIDQFKAQASDVIKKLLKNEMGEIPNRLQILQNTPNTKKAVCKVLADVAYYALRADEDDVFLRRSYVKYAALADALDERGVLK